jgi:hypothetical protein
MRNEIWMKLKFFWQINLSIYHPVQLVLPWITCLCICPPTESSRIHCKSLAFQWNLVHRSSQRPNRKTGWMEHWQSINHHDKVVRLTRMMNLYSVFEIRSHKAWNCCQSLRKKLWRRTACLGRNAVLESVAGLHLTAIRSIKVQTAEHANNVKLSFCCSLSPLRLLCRGHRHSCCHLWGRTNGATVPQQDEHQLFFPGRVLLLGGGAQA